MQAYEILIIAASIYALKTGRSVLSYSVEVAAHSACLIAGAIFFGRFVRGILAIGCADL